MKFPYTLNLVESIETGDEIVVLRPEVPLRVYGPTGHVDVIALVDSGADNSIFPTSVATNLGIETTPGTGPSATAFGGQQIALSFAEVDLNYLIRMEPPFAGVLASTSLILPPRTP